MTYNCAHEDVHVRLYDRYAYYCAVDQAECTRLYLMPVVRKAFQRYLQLEDLCPVKWLNSIDVDGGDDGVSDGNVMC